MLRRLSAVLPMLAVTLASLLLLVYTGYGEASRVYPKMRLERVASLGDALHGSIETFMQTGLPLRQFIGFAGQAEQIGRIDPAIAGVAVQDQTGARVFAFPQGLPQLPGEASRLALGGAATVAEDGARYAVSLPIRDKFGPAGSAALAVDRQIIESRIAEAFKPVFVAAGLALAAYLALQLTSSRPGGRRETFGFVAAFLVVAATLIYALFGLFAEGVRAKTEGLAQSVAGRLGAAAELGIDLASFDGVDRVLAGYIAANPELSYAALVRGGTAAIHTDATRAGLPYAADPDSYEFAVALPGAGGDRVALAVPKAAVFDALWRSGKNFVVLFIASGILGLTLLAAGRALGTLRAPTGEQARQDAMLALVKPAYLLTVFTDSMSISFLPQMATAAAEAAGLGQSWATAPFTVYFLCLTAVLVPAGRQAAHGSLKGLMMVGAACAAAGLFTIALWPGLPGLLVGRGLSGAGQGMLLIAVQAYSLAVSGKGRRTQAAAVQIHGFNGGLIAGAAIGGLLAAFTSQANVFLLAGVLGLAALGYMAAAVADVRGEAPSAAPQSFTSDLAASLRDAGFVRALLLVGIVSKFVVAGVVMFAVPLILHRAGYPQEDIGQLVMVYAVTTLLVTNSAARLVDRLNSAKAALFAGSLMSGFGMLVFAVVSAHADPAASMLPAPLAGALATVKAALGAVPLGETLAIALGLVLIGIAQGLVAAPIITEITDTLVAQRRGRAAVSSIYRLLERVGHISGPAAVGRLLAATGGNPLVIGAIGIVSIVGGSAYAITAGRRAGRLQAGVADGNG
ncbi:MAG TPA: MFS transporter [Alphaproteobacteria bacterium]|nr:MFS transporter [Alphaproteobacteria bacterium]